MPLKIVRHPNSSNLYLRGTVRGIKIYETTGTDREERAEEIRIKREAELLDQSIHGRKVTVTFMDAAIAYLANGGSHRFIGKRDKLTGKWSGITGHFESRKLLEIGQEQLDQAAKQLYPEAEPETRNRQVYTPFIAVWNYAATNGWCDKRDWRRPRRPRGTGKSREATRRGTRPVSYERAAKFVTSMAPATAIAMTILFYSGIRPIELFAMHTDDADPDARWFVVPDSKTGDGRGVPMHEFIVPLIRALKLARGPLVTTPKGLPYEMTQEGGGQMHSAILGAAKRSGVEDISPYTARHSVSTQLVIQGVHAHIKDQILGHAVTDMSRHYTRVPQAPLIEAINALPIIEAWATAPFMLEPEKFARSRRLHPWTPERWAKTLTNRVGTYGRRKDYRPSEETKEKIRQRMKAYWAQRRGEQ